MSHTVSKLLEIARSQIGYKEKETNYQLDSATGNAGDDNYTKYARDLHAAGYYQASKQGFAWCDMFVDWCFLQLCGGNADTAQKMIFQSGPYGAGCKFSAQYYQDAGRYFEEGQAGDQIFFNGYAHTGIVESVAGGIVTTIEGNTSNMVARRTYAVGAKCIDGYGRPEYDSETAAAPVTGKASTGSDADTQEIYDALVAGGLTPAGAAGLMGNFMAECAMRSNNLQNSYQTKLGYTDESYTAAVDSGAYGNFAKDSAGYGLAQWTYWTRKRDLLAFAKKQGKSIGDAMMQVAFALQELKGYSKVLKVLQTTTSVKEASDIVLTQYERPADMSDAVKEKRAAYGQKIYEKCKAAKAPAQDPAKEPAIKDPKAAAADLIAELRKQGYTNHQIYRIGVAVKNDVYDAYIDDMAKLVIAGEYGNGEERKQKLAAEGHPFAVIQTRVNKILAG